MVKIGKKSRIALIACVLAVFLFWFFGQEITKKEIADLPQIIKRGRLVVVTDDSNNGFAMRGDSVFGFEYEIVKAFADSLGVELLITRENDIQRAIESMKRGDYDIVAKFIPNTLEAQRGVTLTQPIFNTRQMLVQRKPQPTDSVSRFISVQYELGGDTIFIPSNSFYRQRIENLMQEIADTVYIREMANISVETMVALVAEGKIPRTVCSEIFTNKYKNTYPDLDFSLPVGFTQEQCWAVNIHSPRLAEKLNAFLADFQESMAYWELYGRYY